MDKLAMTQTNRQVDTQAMRQEGRKQAGIGRGTLHMREEWQGSVGLEQVVIPFGDSTHTGQLT